jgi:hypothetical protein
LIISLGTLIPNPLAIAAMRARSWSDVLVDQRDDPSGSYPVAAADSIY